MILAGTGFRTSLEAHVEAAEALDRPVVSLQLVDPRFYHLDTALAVLDDGGGDAPADIAYYPGAFSPHSRRTLRDLFPDAVQVSEMDALVLGLNAVSDGLNVVLPTAAIRVRRDPQGPRLRAGAGRARRAAQVRRQRQVLHHGAARLRLVRPSSRSSGGRARGRCPPG